ncbi:sensor histidine kinase [Cellulosimicrobium marinum]|uniref:sensor histidine kinase n=1 Tax=Cellulosimicrobium marinum TaxID=1638992 RepID=UPI001E64EBF6|nr:sensor histidine kinase [Cellulosimicrobium marinum]MCB7136610.1 sensor histidine kinase [Cellulosimicrobium marinum]
MIGTVVRSVWDEPRVADPPGRTWRDGALVGVVMVAAVLEGILRDDVAWWPVVTVAAVALAPVLLWRRTHPLVCVAVGFGASTTLGLLGALAGVPDVGLDTMVFLLVLVHALVRWGSGRQVVVGLAVVAVAATVGTATADTAPAELLGGLAVLVAAAAAGAAARYRAESRRRALDQVRDQERVHLARELHDSVAHHVSAITLQAQAGRAVAGQRPGGALDALARIEEEATRTLAEMRAMVRVLRDRGPADHGPQPGIADLVPLARRAPDPVVDVDLADDLDGVQPQVSAAVYRIAVEALTNALRHARDASRVEITVTEDAGRVCLRVVDDGRTTSAQPAPQGFGLLGMTERARLLGGTLRSGPTPGGGWAVDAELPTEAPR